MKTQFDSVSKILKNYDLCEYCAGRIISKIVVKQSSKLLGKKYLDIYNKSFNKKCYICKNLFDTLEHLGINIVEKLLDFNFKSFDLGIILKPSLLERDDYVKSKFKIKGAENLKFSIAKELEKKISKKTSANRTSDNPELFIEVNLKDESCNLRAKPLIIYGRYNKKIRNLSQKQRSCSRCNGIGCHNCEFKGIETMPSIEGTISNFLINKFDCKQVKINWIGGEDQISLVMGNGRPFFAKLLNPKKRNKILRKTYDLKDISLSELQKINVQPTGFVRFKSEVSITVETIKPVSLKQLKKLKTLENTPIDDSQDKTNFVKHIHKLNYKKIGKNQFTLELVVDGGISIKSLVQNSSLTPNISDLIKNECKCIEFDFQNILI